MSTTMWELVTHYAHTEAKGMIFTGITIHEIRDVERLGFDMIKAVDAAGNVFHGKIEDYYNTYEDAKEALLTLVL